MAIAPDSLLNGRYRILEVIAKGGMGAVYRALDETLGVQVAVKENLVISEEAARQFHREATLLAALRHPNLPRVTDHFLLAGQGQYLVMDYIEGEDLRARLKQMGSYTPTEAVLVGAEVCNALSFLHSRTPPVVHRDIKQGNIKISPTGQVFLVDFGLAKIAEQGAETTTGARALTPGYASPEHYGSGTDPRSDIYSLGATLYSILANRLPEDGLARKLETAHLSPLRDLNPRVSEELARVIEKAMSINAADRYQTALEFRNALLNASPEARQILKQNQESQEAASQPTRLGSSPAVAGLNQPNTVLAARPVPRKKFPVLWIFVVVGLLGIAAAAVVLPRFLRNTAGQPGSPTAVAPSETPPPQNTATTEPLPATELPVAVEPTLINTATALPQATPTLAATPVGGTGAIAFVSNRSGLPQIYRLEPASGETAQIFENPDGACQPSWSPDGTRLVFVSPCRERQDTYPGSGLFIINLDGTGLTPLISVPGGDFEPAWSPDGSRIAFSSLRDGILHLYVYNLATNAAARISSQSSFDRQAAWSPDGSTLAFQSTRLGLPQIWTISASGESPKEFSILSNGAASMPTWDAAGSVLVYSQGSNLPVLVARQVGAANAPEVRLADLRPAGNAEFSPDGYWLLLESTQDGNLDIYRMTRNGANLTRLTDDPAQDFDPVWQPLQP
ncbi:protein kinase domain-containing protein [Ornatilinea apprima]|uniref:protein kinase domain-containing protein n=1 Tax=Ornatilinea apprima TaxID=1134406 RepID=UPI0009462472|nr:protein kinase [Ornatilinea apprima]